ncbi:unnamed protein product [Thelazia callipaeda]|uniref:Uncharacterized protein n=1 Tax=Thelazia callipaeda TaxID=103827 RepID=A0A0N5DBI9_THECL|nr:unnamed protein product [Thelazia callipaeda]
MSSMCTDDEIAALSEFMDKERPSVEIARLVTLNMTNDERDRVNLLERTNDLLSLRVFYLSKYQSLPRDKYEMLRKSYSKILSKFTNNNLKENIAQFLNTLTPNDSAKLKVKIH